MLRAPRVENRIASADVNPYLAIAASLACGYPGLTQALPPRPPGGDPACECGHRLPPDLERALDALEACTKLKLLLGERFIRTYLAVKRTEEIAHFKVISSWVREYLLLCAQGSGLANRWLGG